VYFLSDGWGLMGKTIAITIFTTVRPAKVRIKESFRRKKCTEQVDIKH
jgi:hypothetical protein